MARGTQGASGPAENKKTGPREDLEKKNAGASDGEKPPAYAERERLT